MRLSYGESSPFIFHGLVNQLHSSFLFFQIVSFIFFVSRTKSFFFSSHQKGQSYYHIYIPFDILYMEFWPIFFDFDILDPFSGSKLKFRFILLVKIFPSSMQLVDLLRPYLLISLGHHHPFMSLSFLLFSTLLIHHLSSSLRFWPYFYPISFPVKPSHTGAYFTPKWLFCYLHIGLWFIIALAPLISFLFWPEGADMSITFDLSSIIYHLSSLS